jgi:hypothetical protein
MRIIPAQFQSSDRSLAGVQWQIQRIKIDQYHLSLTNYPLVLNLTLTKNFPSLISLLIELDWVLNELGWAKQKSHENGLVLVWTQKKINLEK